MTDTPPAMTVKQEEIITIRELGQEWFDILSGLIEARLMLKKRVKALERENEQLVRENEILREKLQAQGISKEISGQLQRANDKGV